MKFVSADESPFVPASHEDPRNPGVLKRVIADKSLLQAGQVQMLNWSRLPVGSSFQPHYHEDMQEIFVLLNGRVEMFVGSQVMTMGAGDTVIVAPQEIHRMQNVGDVDAEYLVFGISSGQHGKTVIVNAATRTESD